MPIKANLSLTTSQSKGPLAPSEFGEKKLDLSKMEKALDKISETRWG